jgi:hypothetical protein
VADVRIKSPAVQESPPAVAATGAQALKPDANFTPKVLPAEAI